MKRFAPYLIAFTLPLGFWGVVGVVGIGLYSVASWRKFLGLGRRPLYAAMPFALITVLAAAIGVDPGSSLPPAIGLALMMTIGLQGARLLVANSDSRRLMAAFLLGISVLALSVGADYLMGINPIPSGLFRDPSLHNWAGTLFVLGFPLALSFAGRPPLGMSVFGTVCSLTLAAGTALALSWVGMLGLAAGGLGSLMLRRRMSAWVLLGVCVVIFGTYGQWRGTFDGRLYEMRLRGHSLATLEYVASERLAMIRDGTLLALSKPWLGWGYAAHRKNLAETPGLARAQAEWIGPGANATNLLAASEDFGAFPWIASGATVARDQVEAPDETRSAELISGEPNTEHRVFQVVPILVESQTYTFSVWARSESGPNTLALAVRDAVWSSDIVAALKTDLPTQLLTNEVARYRLDEEWQRLWVTAELHASPRTDLLVTFYLDGQSQGLSSTEPFAVWGAQLNVGAQPLEYVPASTRRPLARLRHLTHFHNGFVQVMFEAGSLGLAALIGLLTAFLVRSSGSNVVPVRVAIIAFLTTQLFDYTTHQSTILLSALLVGALGDAFPGHNGYEHTPSVDVDHEHR